MSIFSCHVATPHSEIRDHINDFLVSSICFRLASGRIVYIRPIETEYD